MFLTWRLAGSLPANRHFPEATTAGEVFLAMDRLLDRAETGPVYLKREEIAGMVVDAIRYRAHEMTHYDLHSYVVMANHVHLLVTPFVPVSKVTQSLKRFTARQANDMLKLTGRPFWQDGSYDRVIRNLTEFRRIQRYIEWNPVNAGLVDEPVAFRWSSAGAD